MRKIDSGIRERLLKTEEAPSLGEIDSQTATSIRGNLTLLEASHDAFDEVVEKRANQARTWRLSLLIAAFAPLALAGYLVVGLCLAIIQAADQMRDVTDCVLSENGSDRVKVTIEARDELGRMIEHFGRLAVRLRQELVVAQAEALRASAAEESLRVNQERFDLVLRGANDGIWDWDLHTDHVFYSERFQELLGYTKGEFDVWLSALADILHPDDFDMTWKAIERHFQDREPYDIEHRLKTKSGEYRWFLERGQAVWDGNGVPIRMAGSIKDITHRKAAEARERVRNRVLEMLATGANLSEVLEALVRSVETENSKLRGSILILDQKQERLFTAAAPSLPDDYNQAINGLEIGVGAGSCGTAAFLGQRVIVEDVATHPYWSAFRDIAASADVASCWSEPIRGMSGVVLGTFAIYGTTVGGPAQGNIELMEVAANLAGIAIERRRVDDALRESEERWKFALEGAGDGVWDWNIQTGEILLSRRWCEMLGFDESEMECTLEGWKGLIHPQDLVDVLQSLRRYLDAKSVTYMHEHRMLCRDGSVKWILSRGIVVSRDPSGAPLRMIGTHSDITDRKRIEEDSRRYLKQVEASRDRITEQSVQLVRQSEELARARDQAEAAARAKSEFLANMSHELRTPLTAILGYADLLYDDDSDGGNVLSHRETVDIIRSNGRHLQALIDDILDLSKIDADRMMLELGQVSPRQLVEDVLCLMQLRAREKGLSLQMDCCFPLPGQITTDALRVRQILVNLIGNAIKFTARGTVRVSVRYDAATHRQIFAVEDTGIGIQPDQLQRLFSPFSQADASMSRRFGGTGLGLSISKRLAQMLGGDITVESTYGSGSTFTLEIVAEMSPGSVMLDSEPETEAAPVAPVRPAAEPAPRLTGRVLLAEDVPANQKLISFLLQKWGATVQVVDNGALAVDAALKAKDAGAPFDLILMDIQMPEMDGYTATGVLREKGYAGRIIALTAHASDDDRDRCLNSGFDGFAVKPIQRDQLYATCREHLEATQPESTSAVT
jgi:PAS domain S-box-containing protein